MSFSLEDAPDYLAGYLGITTATAQVLLSTVVIIAIVGVIAILSKGNNMQMIIGLFFGETLCVGLTWLPLWLLIMTAVGFSMAFAKFGADMTTGG